MSIITLQQAASQLKVSEKSIRRYIKAGRIKAKLVKGEKGYEYRIDKAQLTSFDKPPRGRLSHQSDRKTSRVSPRDRKQGNKITRKNNTQDKKNRKIGSIKTNGEKETYSDLETISSLSELIQNRLKNIAEQKQINEMTVDYKLLYEKLLMKYEQCLVMIGGLENQLNNRSVSNTSESEKVRELEQKLFRQEELILELYQNFNISNEQLPPHY